MTQADLARLCDLVRGVSRLLLGVAGVACYLLVRPVVRRVGRRGNRQDGSNVSSSSAARSSDQ